MGISRVDYGGDTLIDLTNDSVTADMLAKGATAHNAAGEQLVGTFEPSLIVTITKNADSTLSADKTNQEIYDAFQQGIYIEARRPDWEMVYRLYDAPNSNTATFVSTTMDSSSGAVTGCDTIKINYNAVTYQSVSSKALIGSTTDFTPTQVCDAVKSGKDVSIKYVDSTYGTMHFTTFNVAEAQSAVGASTVVYFMGVYMLFELEGLTNTNTWSANTTQLAEYTDIPTSQIYWVTITDNDGTYTADKTFDEISTAMLSGQLVCANVPSVGHGGRYFHGFVVAKGTTINLLQVVVPTKEGNWGFACSSGTTWTQFDSKYFGAPYELPQKAGTASKGTSNYFALADHVHPAELPTVTASDNGKLLGVASGAWGTVDMPVAPTSLPNPNALTINFGGTTVTYDGSEAKSINIDVVNVYSGSGEPAADLGSDDDIYLDMG